MSGRIVPRQLPPGDRLLAVAGERVAADREHAGRGKASAGAGEGGPIAGMARTGRKIGAPALELVEVVAISGLKHLVLVHHEAWRGHPVIGSELPSRLGFMEQPE